MDSAPVKLRGTSPTALLEHATSILSRSNSGTPGLRARGAALIAWQALEAAIFLASKGR